MCVHLTSTSQSVVDGGEIQSSTRSQHGMKTSHLNSSMWRTLQWKPRWSSLVLFSPYLRQMWKLHMKMVKEEREMVD